MQSKRNLFAINPNILQKQIMYLCASAYSVDPGVSFVREKNNTKIQLQLNKL